MNQTLNQPEKMVPKTYTVAEIAIILNVSERTAYNLCNNTKDFEIKRIGRCIRIKRDSFDSWFKEADNLG
jgi:excisionase family DNA binding protein